MGSITKYETNDILSKSLIAAEKYINGSMTIDAFERTIKRVPATTSNNLMLVKTLVRIIEQSTKLP